jgi:hypothetical protein
LGGPSRAGVVGVRGRVRGRGRTAVGLGWQGYQTLSEAFGRVPQTGAALFAGRGWPGGCPQGLIKARAKQCHGLRATVGPPAPMPRIAGPASRRGAAGGLCLLRGGRGQVRSAAPGQPRSVVRAKRTHQAPLRRGSRCFGEWASFGSGAGASARAGPMRVRPCGRCSITAASPCKRSRRWVPWPRFDAAMRARTRNFTVDTAVVFSEPTLRVV